jgi:hypothetical protein
MASQVNPLVAGTITEDPRFNKRYGLEPEMNFPEFFPAFGGPPANSVGQNGDFAFRPDGTVAGHTVIYHKEAGAWVATGA